jgi:hypothetical protein
MFIDEILNMEPLRRNDYYKLNYIPLPGHKCDFAFPLWVSNAVALWEDHDSNWSSKIIHLFFWRVHQG